MGSRIVRMIILLVISIIATIHFYDLSIAEVLDCADETTQCTNDKNCCVHWIEKAYPGKQAFYVMSYSVPDGKLRRDIISIPGFDEIPFDSIALIPHDYEEINFLALGFLNKTNQAFIWEIDQGMKNHIPSLLPVGDLDFRSIPRITKGSIIYTTTSGICRKQRLKGTEAVVVSFYPLHNTNLAGDVFAQNTTDHSPNNDVLHLFEKPYQEERNHYLVFLGHEGEESIIMEFGNSSNYRELDAWGWCGDNCIIMFLRRSDDIRIIDVIVYNCTENTYKAILSENVLPISINDLGDVYNELYCSPNKDMVAYIQTDYENDGCKTIKVLSLVTGNVITVYSEEDSADDDWIAFPYSIIWS